MKSRYRLPAFLIGFTSMTLMVNPVAIAERPEVIKNLARNLTVLIQENGQTQTFGHGGIVDHNPNTNTYYVLTNKHVVKNENQSYTIKLFEQPELRNINDIIYFDDIDLAIVSFTAPPDFEIQIPTLSNSDEIRDFELVYMSLFSRPGYEVSTPISRPQNGEIIARISDPDIDDGYELIHDIQTESGSSGAFLINSEAQVIAIHGRTNLIRGNLEKDEIRLAIPINTYKEKAAQAYIQYGRNQLKQGNYNRAIENFKQVLKTRQFNVNNENKAEAYTGIGYARFAQRNYQKAIENANNAIQNNDQLAEAYFLKGASYARLEDEQQAIQSLNRAITLSESCNLLRQLRDSEEESCRNNQSIPSPSMGIYISALNDGGIEFPSQNPNVSQQDPPRTTIVRQGDSIILSTAISPDGKILAIGDNFGDIRLRNLQNNQERTLAGHVGGIKTLAFSKDGRVLASSGKQDALGKVWNIKNLNNPELVNTFSVGDVSVTSIDFNPSGQSLIATRSDGVIEHRLLDGRFVAGESNGRFRENSERIASVAINPRDLKTIAIGTEEGNIEFWTVIEKEFLNTFSGHQGSVTSIVYSEDAETLVSGDINGKLKIWNLETGQSQTENVDGRIFSVAISPDGTKIASGSASQVQLWNLDGSSQGIIAIHDRPFRGVFFTDNRTIIAITEDGEIKTIRLQ